MRATSILLLPVLLLAGPEPRASAGTNDFLERTRAHYAQVERELAARSAADLTTEQRAERERLIAELHEYRERGDFGAIGGEPGERVPQFVDASGRRCAVAQLLHASGEDDLVARVHASDNEVWVLELAGDAAFASWLQRSGLSLAKAARIQVPASGGYVPKYGGYRGPGGDPTPAPPPPRPPDRVPPEQKPVTQAPRGAARPFGSGPAPASPPGVTAPNTHPGPSTPPPMESDSDWWLWWEYNKLAYLQPHRLRLWDVTRTGDDVPSYDERVARLRSSMLPAVKRACEHSDASVRAAAAVAFGRCAGSEAVEPLRALLADPSERVRQRAILALGATGSAEALSILLALTSESAPGGSRRSRTERPTPLARPLAIVALGLGRRAGFDSSVDAEVARLLEGRRGPDRERIAVAAMVYHTLAPSSALEALALGLATDRKQPVALRCRAAESLRSSHDPAVHSKLQDLLSGPSLELRRSAALALGAIGNDLALPALLTAYELEAEPLARGFLLISIGQRGGLVAREFLLRVHKADDNAARPWCALALGILARRSGDPALRDALRAGAEAERNHDSLAAWWIASGLAQDEQAVPGLERALAEAADARERMYAATALALVGSDAARLALLGRLPLESSPLVRVAIAQALGQIGELQDARPLFDVLAGLREPELEGLCAVALGFHGSSEALRGVAELAAARTTSAVPRAAAIDALGILLAASPAFALADVSRQANHAVFSDWVDELFQVTL